MTTKEEVKRIRKAKQKEYESINKKKNYKRKERIRRYKNK